MRDPRFATIQVTDIEDDKSVQFFADGLGGRHDTIDAAHDTFVAHAERAEQVAGRRLSRQEILSGVNHPQSDDRTQMADRARRQQELAGPPPTPETNAEVRLRRARESQEATLPRSEQAVLAAQRAVDAERAALAEQQARESALSTPAAIKLKESIAALRMHVLFDESVPESIVSEISHLHQLLHKFGDVSSVNLRLLNIQKQLFADQKTREQAAQEQHQQVADRITARRNAILAGRIELDAEPTFTSDLLGVESASVSYLGETKSGIPADQVRGLDQQQILAKHFGVNPLASPPQPTPQSLSGDGDVPDDPFLSRPIASCFDGGGDGDDPPSNNDDPPAGKLFTQNEVNKFLATSKRHLQTKIAELESQLAAQPDVEQKLQEALTARETEWIERLGKLQSQHDQYRTQVALTNAAVAGDAFNAAIVT